MLKKDFINDLTATTENGDIVESDNPLTLSGQFSILSDSQADPTLCKVSILYSDKNRYSNVLALESTRVKTGKYVNANYVSIGNDEFMIATQGPMNKTISDFWEMIATASVNIILMLTSITEENKKCAVYWPKEGRMYIVGGFIENIGTDFENDFVKITKLKFVFSGNEREIYHIYYFNWNDFDTPNIDNFRKTLEILNKYRFNLGIKNPFVCHCSAGLRRTGVVTAILRIQNTNENICEAVKNIRKYRPGLVQTVQQYKFIDAFVKLFQSF